MKKSIVFLFIFIINTTCLMADYGHDMAVKASKLTTKISTLPEALYYLEEAAKSDNLKASKWAKSVLGHMYFYGRGVGFNSTKAKRYLEEAGDIGNAKATLGLMYLDGQKYLGKYGIKEDTNKGLTLLKEAAEKNNYLATKELSWFYYLKNNKINKYWQDKTMSLQPQAIKNGFGMKYIETVYSNDNIVMLLENTEVKMLDETKYLIVIGAENYEYTDNIVYSQHTAQMFTKVAQKTLGISKSNTLELTSKNASMGRIQMKMKKLLRRVKKGDTVYFYYSGHGIPVTSQKNEPYILPIDVEPEYISEAPFFKLKNIYKTLGDSKASKVVVFVDSCFSGATDGVSVIKGVAATRLKPKNITFDKKKMVIITAGKDKQYSNMYEEKGYRLFSYYLMESMLKGRTSVKDIYNELYLNVKDKSYEMGDMKLQEPTLNGNKDMKL